MKKKKIIGEGAESEEELIEPETNNHPTINLKF